jgi:hypothetical protein
LDIEKSRKHPGDLCKDGIQGKEGEFTAASSFGFTPTPDCKRPITTRLPKKGWPLSRTAGSQALRIVLLGAVFALSNPPSMDQGEVRALEFNASSATSLIGGWWRALIRPDRTEEKSPGPQVEKQPVSLPAAKDQSRASQNPSQESGNPAQPAAIQTDPADGTSSGVQVERQLMSLPPSKDQSPVSENLPQQSETAAPPIANSGRPTRREAQLRDQARPLNEVDQYLWSVYQRSETKRDGSGDFTWKDAAASARLGLRTDEYVIGGMDPDFRELLFNLGHAMDAAGIDWTILSAFRDDYRQGLAAGFKAHRGYSFHGGSIATGGYGHGCAADLEATDGSEEANNAVWKWLDQHGERFGIRRPMRQIDPAHIQPVGAWHDVAADLRDKRVEIRHADLPLGAAGAEVEKQIFPVSAAEAGVSEAQFECVRSHHRGVEHLRTAGLLSHSRLHLARVLTWDRRHRHAGWRMLADIRTTESRPGAEASPNADELPRTAKSRIAESGSLDKHPAAEPSPTTDEPHRTAKRRIADSREPDKHPAAEPVLNTDETRRTPKWRTVADMRNPHKRPAAEPLLDTDRPHRSGKWRTLADIRGPQKRPGIDALRRSARSKAHLHFVGPVFDAAGKRS